MGKPDQAAPALPVAAPQAGNHWFLTGFVLGALWLEFFNELRGEWDVNPQYSYGYVVPLLGILLLWRRWPERPDAGLIPTGNTGILVMLVGLMFWLLPLRIILEANPEWRLAYWVHGGLMLAFSFTLIYQSGGWRWVKYFAPPLLFMLVAIPWPMDLEQDVIQGLMRGVAAVTVEVVGWLGIPALQHGNLIEVGTGIVGINEACSGVRSLQSALMLSLFLGELYRFPGGRRWLLLGASIVTVLLANIMRTSFLTWAAAQHGLQRMEAWHDTAGQVVMIIILPALFGLAWLIRPKTPRTFHDGKPKPSVLLYLPSWLAVGIIGWIVVVEVATNKWYTLHEKNLTANTRWSVAWPTQNSEFKKAEIPAESLAILRCSNSDSASWEDEDGNQWNAFFLRWNAGKNSEQLARGHRPDICFPAAGANLVADLGKVTGTVDGVSIPFKHQTFASHSGTLQVFYCLWSDRISAHGDASAMPTSWRSRLKAVQEGKRNLGQQVLEVIINGPESDAAAVALFQKKLSSLVRLE